MCIIDYHTHPCNRECLDDSEPKECKYDFTIEYYYTLTQACYDCPYNITDCLRPHCVSADGVSRAIMTVNRKLPGPAIHVSQITLWCSNKLAHVFVKEALITLLYILDLNVFSRHQIVKQPE